MKRLIVCIALLMAFVMGGSALAASVTYVDRTELFDFKPGSVYEVTDLFESFKNVMPGDVLEQKITVRNGSKEDIRIWLQCKEDSYVTAGAKDFLDQLKLTVTSGDSTIFEAEASEKAQLTEPTLLGAFRENGKVELTVTLEVPIELGNQYMGAVGVVPWTFLVEAIPVEDPTDEPTPTPTPKPTDKPTPKPTNPIDGDTPDTGDWFQMGIWVSIAVLLAAAIVILLIVDRKRRTEED